MSGSADRIDWRRFREFAHVDLANSYVLSWSAEDESIRIDVDLRIMPGHSFYEKPRPAEKVCIRAATIEFPDCESLSSEGRSVSGGFDEFLKSLRTGGIRDLTRRHEGPYELSGDFGTVTIQSDRPIVRIRQG